MSHPLATAARPLRGSAHPPLPHLPGARSSRARSSQGAAAREFPKPRAAGRRWSLSQSNSRTGAPSGGNWATWASAYRPRGGGPLSGSPLSPPLSLGLDPAVTGIPAGEGGQIRPGGVWLKGWNKVCPKREGLRPAPSAGGSPQLLTLGPESRLPIPQQPLPSPSPGEADAPAQLSALTQGRQPWHASSLGAAHWHPGTCLQAGNQAGQRPADLDPPGVTAEAPCGRPGAPLQLGSHRGAGSMGTRVDGVGLCLWLMSLTLRASGLSSFRQTLCARPCWVLGTPREATPIWDLRSSDGASPRRVARHTPRTPGQY